MEVTIKFQKVADGLPPRKNELSTISVECMVIVNAECFDRSVCYDYKNSGWVWADLAIGNDPEDYLEELGGENAPTHWAPWPVLTAV